MHKFLGPGKIKIRGKWWVPGTIGELPHGQLAQMAESVRVLFVEIKPPKDEAASQPKIARSTAKKGGK